MPKSSGTHNRDYSQRQIEWCREQQRDAIDHMKHVPGSCGHPQCCPENNERWLLDAFAEEIEISSTPLLGIA
jgi:hypothetical protein